MSGYFELLWDIIYKENPSLKTLRVTHEQKVHEFIDSLLISPDNESNVGDKVTNGTQPTSSNIELQKLALAINDLKRCYLDGLNNLEMQRERLIAKQIEMMSGAVDVEKFIDEENRRKYRLTQELERHTAFMDGVRKHPNTLQAEWKQFLMLHLRNGEGINFTFQQLAATIALWRISVLVSDSVYRLDGLMTVLLDEVVADMLEPYGVGKKVVEMPKGMQATYHRSLYP